MPERWEKIRVNDSLEDFVFVHLALYGITINRIIVDRVNDYYAEVAEDAKKAGFMNATRDNVSNIGEEFVDKARNGNLPHAFDQYRPYNRLIQENIPVQIDNHVASDRLHFLGFFLFVLVFSIFNLITSRLQPMNKYDFVVGPFPNVMAANTYLNGSAYDYCDA